MGLLDKILNVLKMGGPKEASEKEVLLKLVHKEPENAKAHLKLAEIYQRGGEKQKAISEYLVAADIFAKNNFFARAMAIYKQLPKQDPSLDHVYLKIADIYRKMGFLGDALAQYRILVQHYDNMGMKEKALEVMSLMAEIDPRKAVQKEEDLKETIQVYKEEEKTVTRAEIPFKDFAEEKEKETFFDLGAELETAEITGVKGGQEISTLDRISGADEIFKELKETSGPSAVDPYFNYNLGVACRELGFFDDAVEQLQIAFENGQKSFEAANLLGLCYKERAMWEEACQSFEKALKIIGIPQGKKLSAKYELGLMYKNQGKTEEALELLREIAAVDQGFRDTKNEIVRLTGRIKGRQESLKSKERRAI